MKDKTLAWGVKSGAEVWDITDPVRLSLRQVEGPDSKNIVTF